MFLKKIDWKDPRYSKWHLSKLGQLNEAQREAFFHDDDVDFPEFTETELKEIALKFPCRVELFHSNVCYGVERSWPKRIFGCSNYQNLQPFQKRMLTQKMVRNAIELHDKYVNADRLKKRIRKQILNTLAPYYEERYLRHRFHRIQALGDDARNSDSSSGSECSMTTVIGNVKNTSKTDESEINENDGTQNMNTELSIENRIVYQTSSEEEEEEEEDEDEDEYEISTVCRTYGTRQTIHTSSQSDSNEQEISVENMINHVSQQSMKLIELLDDSDGSVEYVEFVEYVEHTVEYQTESVDIDTIIYESSSIDLSEIAHSQAFGFD